MTNAIKKGLQGTEGRTGPVCDQRKISEEKIIEEIGTMNGI